jgi:hypothetical protein
MKKARERKVIEQFLSFLRMNGYPDLVLDDCPDEHNRNSRDIDAIAGNFAIEHTTVDGLPGQRGHDDRFLRLVEGLRVELKPGLLCHANVTICYDDLREVTANSMTAIRVVLLAWLRSILPMLGDGPHWFPRTPELPFAILIRKWTDREPGVYFMRDFPRDHSRGWQLPEQLARKAAKLRTYKTKTAGYITLLLIELNGSALMGSYDFLELFYDAHGALDLDGVDEVWLVNVVNSDCAQFWKLDEEPIGPWLLESDSKEACNPADQASS